MTYKSNAKHVQAKALRAAMWAVNRTMGVCVEYAQAHHDWINRTGTLEGSIGIVTPAHLDAGAIVGRWGSRDVVYAAVHEFGSAKKRIPARPYLRPSADRNYPLLTGFLREGMAKK